MKLSTHNIMNQPIKAMLEQQEILNTVQKQLASGKKVMQPSDDPSGTARANQLRDTMGRASQYVENGDTAEARVNLEETVVDSISNVVQRIRELAVQSLSGTYTESNRQAMGVEVEQLFQEVINLANTRSETGEYLFGGSQGDIEPFSYSETSYSSVNTKENIGVLRPSAAAVVDGNGIVAETLTFAGVREGTLVDVNINNGDTAEEIAANISTVLSLDNVTATAETTVTLENFAVGSDGDSIAFSISSNAANTQNITPTAIATASGATDAEVTTIFGKVQAAITTINTANGDADLSVTDDGSGVISIVSASGRDINISNVTGSGAGNDGSISIANTTVTEGAADSLNVAGSVTVINGDGNYYSISSSNPNNVFEKATAISETLSLTYHGDSEQRDIRVGDSVLVQLNDAGDEIFMNLASAEDPNTSRSLFQTIHGFMTELKSGSMPTSDVLTDLDTGMDRIGETRAKIGSRINLIERQNSVNTDFKIFAQQNISKIEDVDMAEAISLLETQMLTLQVLQQTYSRVSNLSMFNYM